MNEIIAIGIAYLLGAFPSGYLVGMVLKKDILKLGSGNIGTANAVRSLGKLPGVIVFLLDVGKGLFVVFLGKGWGFSGLFLWWMAAAALLGHVYPVYLRFRGGKGLATGLAVTALLKPWIIPIFVLLFLLAYFKPHHVAFASSIGLWGVALYLAWYGIYPGVLIALVMVWRHWPETRTFILEKTKQEPSHS